MATEQSPAFDSSPVDLDAAVSRLDGDWELLKELCVFLVEDAPTNLAAFRNEVAAGNWPKAKLAVHSLKGLFQQVNAAEGVRTAEGLELASANGGPIADADLTSLARVVDRVLASLKSTLDLQ